MKHKELSIFFRQQNSELTATIKPMIKTMASISYIICATEYDLDNNKIERPMRYISISRRNSLFCGSNEAAQRMATLYSLAISCRLNHVNTFTYFKDVIQRLAEFQYMSKEKMRDLLPDKWAENN